MKTFIFFILCVAAPIAASAQVYIDPPWHPEWREHHEWHPGHRWHDDDWRHERAHRWHRWHHWHDDDD